MSSGPDDQPSRDLDLLPLLVRARATRVLPITEQLVASIARENAAYDLSGVVPDEDLWRSCHDNVERVLDMLVQAVQPDGSLASIDEANPLFDAARATGHRRAEQGLPLDDVLRSYRIGGRLIWQDLVENAALPLDPTSFRDLGVWLWWSVDTSSAEVARSYRRTEQGRLRADAHRMAVLWEGLLSGQARDQAFSQEAARRTDLPPEAPLLLVLLQDTTQENAAEELQEIIARFAVATAWHTRASGHVIGLLALPDDLDHRRVLAALGRADGLDGGVSGLCRGLADLDRAFEQARMATQGRAAGAGIAPFEERLVPALLLSSPAVARQLVDRWLTPLRSLPEDEAEELITTLRAWVDSGGSTSQAAAAIPCHRNTVLNRLARVSRLTGHRLTEAPPPTGLALALTAHSLGLG